MATLDRPLDIVFSFDTTGFMFSYMEDFRDKASTWLRRLQSDMHGTRVAIFAHGDNRDSPKFVTRFIDFTDDFDKLLDFLSSPWEAKGGNTHESYEVVLHEARTKLSWHPGTQRALVMVGYNKPHDPGHPDNPLNLDWRKEVQGLKEIGVRIYGVRFGYYLGSEQFYQTIAHESDGYYLQLHNIGPIFDFLIVICYNEKGPEMLKRHKRELALSRTRGEKVPEDLLRLLSDLRNKFANELDTRGKDINQGLKESAKQNTEETGGVNESTPTVLLGPDAGVVKKYKRKTRSMTHQVKKSKRS